MTKRERAIEAISNQIWRNGWVPDSGVSEAILDTAMAIMSEPEPAPEPPEGKLRVRAAVAVSPGGVWSVAGADDFDDELSVLKARPFNAHLPHSIRWIEADVTPWQPPAEETVQGREVEHD